MGIFDKPNFGGGKRRDLPPGQWIKCLGCGEIIHILELERNERICPKCDYHFSLNVEDRLRLTLDADSFEEHDAGLTSVDTLKFTGQASYTDRLKKYQRDTGLK